MDIKGLRDLANRLDQRAQSNREQANRAGAVGDGDHAQLATGRAVMLSEIATEIRDCIHRKG